MAGSRPVAAGPDRFPSGGHTVPVAGEGDVMKKMLVSLVRDEEGQDLVEYALLVALVGLVGIAAWSLIRTNLGTRYQQYDTDTQDLYAPADPAK
jgi:Flp pilus assembly pilin Flp